MIDNDEPDDRNKYLEDPEKTSEVLIVPRHVLVAILCFHPDWQVIYTISLEIWPWDFRKPLIRPVFIAPIDARVAYNVLHHLLWKRK